MKLIDNILDKITMYRLVLYYLLLLLFIACMYCFVGILPYNAFSLLFSAAFLLVVCWLTNKLFSHVFNAPTNVESVYISVLILTLIISPVKSFQDALFLFW